MATSNTPTSTRIVTGEVRLSYANLWEPKSIQGGAPKYSVSLIIPKSDQATLTAINRAIDAAIEAGIAKFGGKKPNKAALKLPLRDGDVEKDDPAYAGAMFLNANSKTPPQIVDENVRITLTNDPALGGAGGGLITLTGQALAGVGNGAPVEWSCSSAIPAKWLPSECRP